MYNVGLLCVDDSLDAKRTDRVLFSLTLVFITFNMFHEQLNIHICRNTNECMPAQTHTHTCTHTCIYEHPEHKHLHKHVLTHVYNMGTNMLTHI